ncbi:hypothetical protein GCM10022409_47010 [Hymenobacter glaciei]|uniref:Uncharacterized protein n=1 Tax=Hymenobacter glaciei TaxID=877209 RepID=A0ABP7UWN4_9BACT
MVRGAKPREWWPALPGFSQKFTAGSRQPAEEPVMRYSPRKITGPGSPKA